MRRVGGFGVLWLLAVGVNAAVADDQASKATLAPPTQAAPPPAIVVAGNPVLGVAKLNGRLYMNVGAWMTKPAIPAFDSDDQIQAWVDQATLAKPLDDKSDVVEATLAPPALKQWVGSTINGFDAKGKPCASTIARLVIWGAHPDGDAGTGGYLLAELKPAAKCKPVIVTERHDLTLLQPRNADAATTKMLRKAFAALPSYQQAASAKPFRKPAVVREYRNSSGKRWALVTAAETTANPDHCGNQYREATAAFTLDDKGAIVAVSEVAAALQSKAAPLMFDHGNLEGLFGEAAFDTGQTGGRRLNAYVTFLSPEAKAAVIQRNWYIGCD